jgi:thiamine-phosphate pyrophosphorylase
LPRKPDLGGVNRIIDANLNRCREGLRVCEEIARFVVNDHGITLSLKRLRHKLNLASSMLAPKDGLLKERASDKDVGRLTRAGELKRKGIEDILYANLQRSKESLRVLEEFSKLRSIEAALKFKELRFKLYEIEKGFAV